MSLDDPSSGRAFASARDSAWAELCGNDEEDDSVETVNAAYGSLLGSRKDKPKKKPVLMLDAKEAAKAFEVMEINAGQLMTNPQRSARTTDFQPVDPLGIDEEEEEILGFANEGVEPEHDDWDEAAPANGSPAEWIASGWNEENAEQSPVREDDGEDDAAAREWQHEEVGSPLLVETPFTASPEPLATSEDQHEASDEDWDDEPAYSFSDGWSKSGALPSTPEEDQEPEPVAEGVEPEAWEEEPPVVEEREPADWGAAVAHDAETADADWNDDPSFAPEPPLGQEVPEAQPESTLSAYVPGEEYLGDPQEDEPVFEGGSLGEASKPKAKKMALAPPPDFEDSLVGLDEEGFDPPLDGTGGFDPHAEAAAFEELDPLAEPDNFVPIMPDPVKHPPVEEKPGHGLRAKVIGNVEPSVPLSRKLFDLLVRICRWAWQFGLRKWQEFQASRAAKGDSD